MSRVRRCAALSISTGIVASSEANMVHSAAHLSCTTWNVHLDNGPDQHVLSSFSDSGLWVACYTMHLLSG